MPSLALGAVMLALVGTVTGSFGSLGGAQAGGVQDEKGASAGAQPLFESRLGLWLEGVSAESDRGHGGVAVREVIRRSGADLAGVREGDVLVECQAERVGSGAEVVRLLEDAPFGSVVRIGLVREGRRLDLEVRLDASRREHFLAPFVSGPVREGAYLRMLPLGGTERLGVAVIELTRQLAEYFGTDDGVLVSSVRHSSPADRAGLKAGDVVTRIDSHPVRTERDLAGALHRRLAGARLTVGVRRDGRNTAIEVKVPR